MHNVSENSKKFIMEQNEVQIVHSEVLPSVISVIADLKNKLVISKQYLEEADNLSEEVLRKDEIRKIEALIQKLENSCEENNDSDIILENTYHSIETKLQQASNQVNSKISNRSVLDPETIDAYNKALIEANLFFNVVESIY